MLIKITFKAFNRIPVRLGLEGSNAKAFGVFPSSRFKHEKKRLG